MRADQRKHHIIYKTTCIITGKWYIGMHSTDDLDDGYIGSGTHLWKSINKHGKDQHVCEVLEYLPTRKDLSNREKEILTQEVINDPRCMNFRTGGTGNQPGKSSSEETRQKLSVAMKKRWSDPEKRKIQSDKMKDWCSSDQNRQIISAASKGHWQDPAFRSKHQRAMLETNTSEYRERLSEAQKKRWTYNDDARQNQSLIMKRFWATDEGKGKKTIAGKIRYAKQAEREKTSKSTKQTWCVQEIRAARIAGLRASHANNPRGKQCTVDGITIFRSLKDLIGALGAGKNGKYHSNFRYI